MDKQLFFTKQRYPSTSLHYWLIIDLQLVVVTIEDLCDEYHDQVGLSQPCSHYGIGNGDEVCSSVKRGVGTSYRAYSLRLKSSLDAVNAEILTILQGLFSS